jgi:hypothetical protein
MGCEFEREHRSTTKRPGVGTGIGEEVIELVAIGSVAVSLARGDHLSYQIEPSAIVVAAVLNRCVLECLTLLVGIDAELRQQHSERGRIDQISPGGEIPTKNAATFFSEAVLQASVYRRVASRSWRMV